MFRSPVKHSSAGRAAVAVVAPIRLLQSPGLRATLLSPMHEVTQVLQRLADGDGLAAAELLPLLYDELRRLAAQRLAHEAPGHTLQATALVHEAYLRLVGDGSVPTPWSGRRHFFAAAAVAMRRILVESARHRNRQKRGGDRERLEFAESLVVAPEIPEDIVALDDALRKFAEVDALGAELVNLRYFAGLTMSEAAAALELAPRTAERLWAYARAWLHRELTQESPADQNS